MNQLMTSSQPLTMSSREIAELTKKEHSNVKRDISAMILQMNYPELKLKDCPVFDPSELKGHEIEIGRFSHAGNSYDEFHLDQDYSMLLVSGYNVNLRMKIIKRWKELEVASAPILPQSFAQALQLAADQAAKLELQAPKVEFHDKIVNDAANFSLRDAAKKIQQRPNKFSEWLRLEGYLCIDNMAKQQYINQGLFKTHTGSNNDDFQFSQTRVTSKGMAYFTKKLGDIKL